MTPAWVEAAKGIPVWEGCRLAWVNPEVPTNGRPMFYVRVEGDDLIVMHPGPFTYGSQYVHSAGRVVPDLTDPDTRAMYLRRLAVALGCPESTADEGVRFYLDDGAGWQMDAGFAEGDVLTHAWYADLRDLGIGALNDTDDRPEALALAWPADKRVTT